MDDDLIQIEIPHDLVQTDETTEFQINDTFTAGNREFQLDGQEVTFTASPTDQPWTRTWSIFAGGSAGVSGSIGSVGAGVSIAAAKASISGTGGVGLDIQINEKDELLITRRMEAGISVDAKVPSVSLIVDDIGIEPGMGGIEAEVTSKLMTGQTFGFDHLNIDENSKRMAQTGLLLETLSFGGVPLSPTAGLIISAIVNESGVEQYFQQALLSTFGGAGIEGSTDVNFEVMAGPIKLNTFERTSSIVLNGFIHQYHNGFSEGITKTPNDLSSETELSRSVEVNFMSEYDMTVLSWETNHTPLLSSDLYPDALLTTGDGSGMSLSGSWNRDNELEFIDFTLRNGGKIELFAPDRSSYRATNVQIPGVYTEDLVNFGSDLVSIINPAEGIPFGNSMVEDFQSSFNALTNSIDNDSPINIINSEFHGKGTDFGFGISIDGAFGAGAGLSLGFEFSLFDEIEFNSENHEIYNSGDNYALSSTSYDPAMEQAQLTEIFQELFSGAVPLLEEAIRNLSGRVVEKIQEGAEFVADLYDSGAETVGKVTGVLQQTGEFFSNTFSPRSNRVVQKAFDIPEVRNVYSSPNVLYSPVGKAAQTEPEKLLEVGSEVIIISQVTDMSFIPEGESEPVDELDSSITLELEIKESDLVENEFDLSDMDRVKIYRYDLETNSWIRLDGELDENTLTTDIQNMGSYALGIEINRSNDETPPEIYDSGFLEETDDESHGEIFASLRDDRYGSGIDFSQTYILLNGDTLSYTLQPTQNRIFYQINEEDNLTGTTEEVKIATTDLTGNQTEQNFSFELVTTNNENDNESPGTFELMDNYPNPFNPQTVIPFSVPEAVEVQIRIYDVLGRYVATLLDERLQAGHHEVVWNSGIGSGQELSTGVYFYQIKAGDFNQVKKMTYLK